MNKVEAWIITLCIVGVMWMIPASVYRWLLLLVVVLPLIGLGLVLV